MKFEIKHRFTGAVLFALETDSMLLCVEAAVKSGADLRWSDLRWSNLRGSNLSGSDLSGSDLRGSDLSGSDLRGSNLSGSDLRWSDLRWSNLSGSDLRWSDLRWSNLRGSNLSGSDLSGAHLQDTHGQKLTLLDDHAVLQLGPLGSRSDYLIAFRTDRGPWLRAGCFWGDLAAFKAAVEETHGAAKHGDEYRAAVAFIEAWNATWTAKTEAR